MDRLRKGSSFVFLILLPVAASIACEIGNNRNSTTLATDRIEADMTVRATGSERMRVVVSMQEADVSFFPDPVKLKRGEELEAHFDGETRRLSADDDSETGPSYATNFETGSVSGPVQVVFHRRNGEVVDEAIVPLRPAFEILEPVPGQLQYFDEQLVVAWDPPEVGRQVEIWMRFSCRAETGERRDRVVFRRVTDDGLFLYYPSEIPEASDPEIDRSRDCSLEIELDRVDAAEIVPPYGPGSTMESSQTRTVSGISLRFPDP